MATAATTTLGGAAAGVVGGGGSSSTNSSETIVVYHIDEEETPYRIRLPVSSDKVTLCDFKNALPRPNFKFFFKSEDDDFGIVKEEINDDNARLPLLNGRVESWLVTADGSAHSDSTGGNAAHVDRHSPRHGGVLGGHGHGHQHYQGGGRAPAVGDSRPPSFHGPGVGVQGVQGQHHHRAVPVDRPESECTSETESTISGLPKFPRASKLDRRQVRAEYYDRSKLGGRMSNRMMRAVGGPIQEGSSAMTSDLETTSFVDSEDDRASRISTSTDITSVSRQYMRRRRKRRMPRPPMSRTSSVSSITESSMSVNIITVTLNMDKVTFLGISIVGHSDQLGGDGGIFVSSVMQGGAVALDGRIEPGDMILQVNDMSFEHMTNDDAVKVLRDAVRNPGPIKLVVAKCWEQEPKGYFTLPRPGNRAEPVCPIDPGAWVAHTNALLGQDQIQGVAGMRVMPGMIGAPGGVVGATTMGPPPDYMRPPSVSTVTSNNSGSFTSSVPESDKYFEDLKLDVNVHSMMTIVRAMARPDSGLDVRDRVWLKIRIPNAFLGAEVVSWLHTNVAGFQDRRAARKYAIDMLKQGYIKQAMEKITFSEQCYYSFSDLCAGFAGMRLGDGGGGRMNHEMCSSGGGGAQSDHETVDPLPPPPPMASAGWPSTGSVGPTAPPPPPGYMHAAGCTTAYAAPTASMASGYAPIPFQSFANYETASGMPGFQGASGVAATMAAAHSEANSASGGSATSSGSEKAKKKQGKFGVGVGSAPMIKEPATTSIAPNVKQLQPQPGASAGGAPTGKVPPRAIGEVQADLSGSRASFRNAMNNPCEFSEFFVDVM